MSENEDWEAKKYELAVRSYRLDLFAKLGVPVGLLVIAAATYFSNVQSTQEHFAFERDAKEKEFAQKQEDLFIRQSESERSRRVQKAAFIAKVMESDAFKGADADEQIEHFAHSWFQPAEAKEVLAEFKRVRLASPASKAAIERVFGGEPKQPDFKKQGLERQQAGNYALALTSFQAATSLRPDEAQAWMFRAYAEYRLGEGPAALRSISAAIEAHPTEQRLKVLLVINATKILCLNNRFDEAVSYINGAIAAIPEVQRAATQDTELYRQCNWKLQSR